MSEIKDIVKIIRESMEKHPEIGELTPNIIDPDNIDGTLGVGIIVKTEEGYRKRFKIMVEDYAIKKEDI